MKKLLLVIGLSVLVAFSGAYAGDDESLETKDSSKESSKEMRRLERKRKKEQRKQERLAKKEEKKKKVKPEKKAKKEKTAKKEKAPKKAKKSREERKLEKQEKKAEKDAKKMERKHSRESRKEDRKLEKVQKDEKKKAKKIENENKSNERKERSRLKKQQKQEVHHMSLLNERKKREDKLAKIESDKAQNIKLAQNWQTVRATSVESDYKAGKYSDLYMLPAWPVSNWFYKEKALINATAFYHYATDAYDSDGASKDLTVLAFGEKPIYVHDIVLASKLLEENKVQFRDPDWISPVNQLLQFWGDKEIKLNGRTEQYGLSLDFMRHVLRDDISVGIQVPMMFMRNRLKLDMDFPTDYESYNQKDMQDMGEFATHDYHEAVKRILRAKGIDHIGGSASGLGDITLFGNVEVTTKWIEKIVTGFKFVLPTARKPGANKLWAPEMGSNGGCTEIAAFISFLLKYKDYINPHLFLQAGFNTPAHVHKRVPGKDSIINDANSSIDFPTNFMSLSDRFQMLPLTSIDEWDSSVRGFGDRVVATKFEKGPEIVARIGNVFEKFLCRRGFMDIFYNLRVKFEDSYRQVNRDLYKIDMLEDNTKQVEHRVGFEYSHQFDPCTRMKAGMIYTFAGVNVPKSFDVGVSFAHSF